MFYRDAAKAGQGAPKASLGYLIFAELRAGTDATLEAIVTSRRAKTPGWSPTAEQREAFFLYGYRDRAHTVAATALTVDYDERPDTTPDWAGWPCEIFAHSTHRWHPESAPGRWRVLLRLKDPIPFGQYAAVVKAVKPLLPPGAVLRAAHQPAFLPTCPADLKVQFHSA